LLTGAVRRASRDAVSVAAFYAAGTELKKASFRRAGVGDPAGIGVFRGQAEPARSNEVLLWAASGRSFSLVRAEIFTIFPVPLDFEHVATYTDYSEAVVSGGSIP
jgi:hypothetical protein